MSAEALKSRFSTYHHAPLIRSKYKSDSPTIIPTYGTYLGGMKVMAHAKT